MFANICYYNYLYNYILNALVVAWKSQAYVHGVASEAISLVEKMLLVSDVIGAWLSSNRLRLNPRKTQFIWVGGRVQLSKIDLSILLERFPGVLFSTTVRDLGVTLDQAGTDPFPACGQCMSLLFLP